MDSLVTTQWLAGELGSPDLVVLDASAHLPDAKRDARAEYCAAHIPGALFLDLPTLFDAQSDVAAALPTRDQFAARLSSLGVENGQCVVVYDNSYVKTAARAWFILRLNGVTEVDVLDGGLGKWRQEQRPLESGEHAFTPSRFRAGKGVGAVRSKADMLANLATAGEQVVDARGAKRFTGEEKDFRPNVADGHIPGSRNLPFDRLFEADGTYRHTDDILSAFRDAGVDPDRPIATTCGGGVTAAVLLFALHLTGRDNVSLYDGSWSEWGSDPATPKETGPAR